MLNITEQDTADQMRSKCRNGTLKTSRLIKDLTAYTGFGVMLLRTMRDT